MRLAGGQSSDREEHEGILRDRKNRGRRGRAQRVTSKRELGFASAETRDSRDERIRIRKGESGEPRSRRAIQAALDSPRCVGNF